MEIHTNTGGPVATNGYLVADEAAGIAALVDAPRDTVAALLNIARHKKWRVEYLLLTHGHWDHLADHQVVTAAFPEARVLIHPQAEPMLLKPGSSLFPLPFTIPPGRADAYFADNQPVGIGSLHFVAMHTPGHAPGHVALYSQEQGLLLAGDLLFAQSIGRVDLPGSDPAAMRQSLLRVMELPDATRVLSGHGPPTTIGAERTNVQWMLRQLG